MDKDAIITFIKKNAFALSCGAVAVASVVLLFYPLGGWITELQEKATTDAAQLTAVSGYSKARTLPNVDPAKATPVELQGFPTAKEVDLGKKAIDKLTHESARTTAYLAEQNVHPPLVPGLLPNLPTKPASDTLKFQFADLYKRVLSTDPNMSGLGATGGIPPAVQANPGPTGLDPVPADPSLSAVRAKNLFNDVLHAGMPADPKLIEARKTWLWQNVFSQQVIVVNGQPSNQTQIVAKHAEACRFVPDELAHEIATKHKVYLDKDAFAYYPAFLPTSNTNPNMTDIWWAQMSLWMQGDIAAAVAAIDGDAKGVADAPVKRILRLDLSTTSLYRNPPASATGGTGGNVPSASTETQALTPTYAVSPTGRTSNAMYDVVPFYLMIDVDASKVNQVLAGLTQGRLMYIDNQSLSSLDPDTLKPLGYLYGSGPIVRLTLSGEELFLRAWTKDLMPLPIQQSLGLAPGGTPGGPGAGGMQVGGGGAGGGAPGTE